MTADDPKLTPAELAARIAAADKPSKPQPKELRLQWNVPRGVQPYIPLWFSLLFVGVIVLVAVANLLEG